MEPVATPHIEALRDEAIGLRKAQALYVSSFIIFGFDGAFNMADKVNGELWVHVC